MTRPSMRTNLAVLVAVAALLTAGCETEPHEVWVIESFGFHGPRGSGQHYVTCVPKGAPNNYDRWRDVAMPGPEDPDSPLDTGAPCPDGPILDQHPQR